MNPTQQAHHARPPLLPAWAVTISFLIGVGLMALYAISEVLIDIGAAKAAGWEPHDHGFNWTLFLVTVVLVTPGTIDRVTASKALITLFGAIGDRIRGEG